MGTLGIVFIVVFIIMQFEICILFNYSTKTNDIHLNAVNGITEIVKATLDIQKSQETQLKTTQESLLKMTDLFDEEHKIVTELSGIANKTVERVDDIEERVGSMELVFNKIDILKLVTKLDTIDDRIKALEEQKGDDGR